MADAFDLFQIICLIFTGWLALGHKIQVGDITLYQSYFTTIVNQVSTLMEIITTIAKGVEYVNTIGEVLLADDVERNEGKKELEKVEGAFEFRVVHFRYHNSGHDVLNGLNL